VRSAYVDYRKCTAYNLAMEGGISVRSAYVDVRECTACTLTHRKQGIGKNLYLREIYRTSRTSEKCWKNAKKNPNSKRLYSESYTTALHRVR
jgi:Zn-finger protein